MAVNLAGCLEKPSMPAFSEVVSITNISGHGARVITHRNWQPHDHAVLMEFNSDFHTDAEVVYCRRLHDSTYVVGLKFGHSIAEALARWLNTDR
jgi:hypothetical protein